MTGKVLALQFGMNIRSMDLNTEGVTHQDSLLAPQPAGNCINWIAGHVLASRNAVHSLLGLAPAWEDGGDRYDRGSRPIADPAEAAPLERILEQIRRSQEAVAAALEAIDEADLSVAADGGKSVGLQLAFAAFHESYHVGQLGILRRILGREPAIK